MYTQIRNTPQPYAWGSRTAIADLQGRPTSEAREAELWMGTHPGSPSRISNNGAGETLDQITTLPFLLKLLAADSPLSLQVHPTIEQAEVGYDAEESAGIPLTAPNRNFKDRMHKPEMVVALSEHFNALSGFRSIDESLSDLRDCSPLGAGLTQLHRRLGQAKDLSSIVAWLLSGEGSAAAAVAELTRSSENLDGASWRTVRELSQVYPGDPGIAIAFLMHRIDLNRGEAVFLAAREIHAYLHGFGVELMAASDNVLRCGLTPKHVDVPALLQTASFDPRPIPVLEPENVSEGIRVFRPPVTEFALLHLFDQTEDVLVADAGETIVLSTRGDNYVGGRLLEQGTAAYVSADEWPQRLTVRGELFAATSTRCIAVPARSRR
jgi:mannose-6-phosphate isomerase